jgi:hypothetical protein
MGKVQISKTLKLERKVDCIVRILCASLASVLITIASLSLFLGQPFKNGAALLTVAIILLSMSLGYQQIELIWKGLRIRLKRKPYC